MPHDWRMRPTSWSKCTARGSTYGSGHCSRITTDRPTLRELDAEDETDRAGADDGDVDVHGHAWRSGWWPHALIAS